MQVRRAHVGRGSTWGSSDATVGAIEVLHSHEVGDATRPRGARTTCCAPTALARAQWDTMVAALKQVGPTLFLKHAAAQQGGR